MPADGYSAAAFAPDDDTRALLAAVREALIDPSPDRIGRLGAWGRADEFETYAEIAQYREIPIVMTDGTRIDAALSTPRNLTPEQPCPVVLMPAPLSPLGRNSYLGMFPRWALGGYAVLAYSQRGLADSGGEIQVAGPQDVADGIEIINWLTELEGVDANRIGCFGASYGAGTSLLLAAKDPRVKAVAGASAWGDLLTSLYENATRHVQAFEQLVLLFREERCSPEFVEVIEKIRRGEIDEQVKAFALARSPQEYLQAYNDNGLPILLTTYWHETIFSVPAVVEFFNSLRSAKSLLVQIGDHGSGELPGLLGLIGKPTEMAYRWMDHHLGGQAGNGVAPEFGVRSEYMHNLLSELRNETWQDYLLPPRRFHLAGENSGQRDAQMLEGPAQAGWTRSMEATGQSTEAVVAPQLVQTGMAERAGRPHLYKTAAINRDLALIWASEPLDAPMRVQGELQVQVTVASTGQSATIVAYLMDADPATGNAYIITHAAYTLEGQQPGQAATITFAIQPAHYVLRTGRQLQLIIDTHDRFFSDANATHSTLTISSPQGSESYIDIPLATLR